MSRALVLCAALLLAGCGLSPMYGGGGNGNVARGLSAVEVSKIEGKAGYLVHSDIVDRLGNHAGEVPRYRLDVRLDDKLEGFALLSNDTVARERRTLRARYQLVDLASGKILLDATTGSDAGIDVVSSDYATIAAEQTALENLARDISGRIVTSVALKLRSDPARGQ